MLVWTPQKQSYLRIPFPFSKADWRYDWNKDLIMLPAFLINWRLFRFKYFVKSQWEFFTHNLHVLVPLLLKWNKNFKKKKLTINVRLIKTSPLTFKAMRFDYDRVIHWDQKLQIRWWLSSSGTYMFCITSHASFVTSFPLSRAWSIISACNFTSLHCWQTTADDWIPWQFSLLGQLCPSSQCFICCAVYVIGTYECKNSGNIQWPWYTCISEMKWNGL